MPESGFFDFVRQHGRERGHRTRRAAMRELAIHLVGDRAFLQHDDHVVRPLRQGRHMQIDEAFAGITRRAEIDLVLVDRRSACAHLVDESQQGASKRHEVAQAMTAQERQGGFEKRFGGGIGIGHPAISRDHDDGMRQRVEHRVGGAGRQRWHRLEPAHAAILAVPPNAP